MNENGEIIFHIIITFFFFFFGFARWSLIQIMSERMSLVTEGTAKFPFWSVTLKNLYKQSDRQSWINQQITARVFSGSRRVNNPTQALSPAKPPPSCSLTRRLHASVQASAGRAHGRHANLPRGSSPSSLLQRTVGAGSPWTSHRKSTVSSSMTTWLTGLRTNTGRSTGSGGREEVGGV